MKKFVAALAVAAALSSPAAAQNSLPNMGGLAANGALIAAGLTFVVIVAVGANADSITTTTTRRN